MLIFVKGYKINFLYKISFNFKFLQRAHFFNQFHDFLGGFSSLNLPLNKKNQNSKMLVFVPLALIFIKMCKNFLRHHPSHHFDKVIILKQEYIFVHGEIFAVDYNLTRLWMWRLSSSSSSSVVVVVRNSIQFFRLIEVLLNWFSDMLLFILCQVLLEE